MTHCQCSHSLARVPTAAYGGVLTGSVLTGSAHDRAPASRVADKSHPVLSRQHQCECRVKSMRGTNMTVRLCVLIVFVTSVCQGAAAPVQRDCDSNCIECICTAESLLQNCSSREPCLELFPERRKRQAEGVSVNVAEAQPAVTSSVEPIVATQSIELTATQPVASTATSAVAAGVNLSTSVGPTSASPIISSTPPPPHPSTTQATAVKSRSCKSGSTWEEECNTCWCLDNGMAACTVKRCEVVSPLAVTQTTKSPVDTTPLPPTSVQTSASPPSSTLVSEASPVQDTSTTVLPSATSLPSTTTILSSSSLPVSPTSSSSGTS